MESINRELAILLSKRLFLVSILFLLTSCASKVAVNQKPSQKVIVEGVNIVFFQSQYKGRSSESNSYNKNNGKQMVNKAVKKLAERIELKTKPRIEAAGITTKFATLVQNSGRVDIAQIKPLFPQTWGQYYLLTISATSANVRCYGDNCKTMFKVKLFLMTPNAKKSRGCPR